MLSSLVLLLVLICYGIKKIDDLVLAGVAALSIDNTTDATNTTSGSFHTDGGVGIAEKLYVGTDLDVDGTANLDAVDIDGAVQIDGTVTVGVDNTGYDVKFFGATSGSIGCGMKMRMELFKSDLSTYWSITWCR